jgi:hypothetical protein
VEAGDDQALVFEAAHGFPHRRARHAQARGDVVVADQFAGRQLQRDDPLLDGVVDVFARQGAADGLGGGGMGMGAKVAASARCHILPARGRNGKPKTSAPACDENGLMCKRMHSAMILILPSGTQLHKIK